MNKLNDKEIEALTQSLFRYFLSKRVGSLDDVWDMVQETLLRVLMAMSKEQIGSPEGYAIGVAKNIQFEQYRKLVKANKHESLSVRNYENTMNVFKHYETPEHIAVRHDMMDKMHQCMTRLPKHMQHVLTERFIKEVPSKVMAQKIGKDHSVIDLRVYRAKRKLRKMLA